MHTSTTTDPLAPLFAAQARWAQLPLAEKAASLEAMVPRTSDMAERWVKAAMLIKGVAPGSVGEGEEWVTGPWALISAAKALARTLRALARGDEVIDASRIHVREDGRLAIAAFPMTTYDTLLFSGYSAEVWLNPQVRRETLERHIAPNLKHPPTEGVALVLGAGNISSIAPLDIFTMLFARNQVALCKLSPLFDDLKPVLENVFAPLIELDAVRFVSGDSAYGQTLADDERVTHVHITGSARSHDALVWGVGEEAAMRRARRQPRLAKSITSELGGVGATIIVPGPWSARDLAFQAEHLATQKLHNSGFNCIAPQLFITQKEWPLAGQLFERVEAICRTLPPRPPYYPGARERVAKTVERCPSAKMLDSVTCRTRIPGLDADNDRWILKEELFGPVWGELALSAPDAASFLARAVDFANDELDGSLGIQLLIHPRTAKELGQHLEHALARLTFGTIGVNVWSGVGFLLPMTPWGAYPGHPLDHIQSGRGHVHNAFLLEGVEKTILRGPFTPFPRSLLAGELHMAPRPPWFVTNKENANIGKLICRFESAPSISALLPLLRSALRGNAGA